MSREEWKLLPSVIEETAPFWEACRRHELVVQHCRSCGAYQHYPRPFCGECYGSDLDWHRCSGLGKIYTFTVTYRNQSAEFRHRTPYVVAYVELEEGIRMLTNIIDCPPEEVAVGMAVEVMFEDAAEEVTIPCFRPVWRPPVVSTQGGSDRP